MKGTSNRSCDRAIAGFFLAVTSMKAQGVDERIKALEQELIRLKEQQIEMKRDATEATAALPTFEYRRATV